MNDSPRHQPERGRGSSLQPGNRFERIEHVDDFEQLAEDEFFNDPPKTPTEYFVDASESIVVENKSPDLGFRYSLNPYRGCSHGCAYCYARPTHEYLGFNAGIDFESKVMVKHDAAKLLRRFLARPAWRKQVETIVFSGVTDCYQPAERRFRLTRACLEVAAECRQPVSIVTKNALVCRDLDVLTEMGPRSLAEVNLSITTLRSDLARELEPRTSTPAARLRAVRTLSEAGVPVNVMVAPVIPGLNDSEIPAILAAAAEHGATAAAYILLRLPLTVEPVFLDWLDKFAPDDKDRVISRIRACRDGNLNDSQFGSRMRGSGPIAEQIQQTVKVFRARHGLTRMPQLDSGQFQPPELGGQMRLFD